MWAGLRDLNVLDYSEALLFLLSGFTMTSTEGLTATYVLRPFD